MTMKKHMNKLVPVAVAGLVFAGAGTVEASAAVAALPTLPEEEMESSERNETSAAPSTTIQAAVSGDPKPVEGGGTETDVSVNPKYDPENNTFTTDGSLTIKKDEDGGLEGITGTVTSPEVEVEFEVFSAMSTVGLSTGITRELSTVNRAVVIVMMYCGRIGSLSMMMALAQRTPPRVKDPVEQITIG